MTLKNLASDVKKLRVLLILLTIVQVVYLLVYFYAIDLVTSLNKAYCLNWMVNVYTLFVMAIFLWYNWKKLPIERKKKREKTLMIVFLGILGMWLWLPNKRERERMIEN